MTLQCAGAAVAVIMLRGLDPAGHKAAAVLAFPEMLDCDTAVCWCCCGIYYPERP